MENDIYDIQFNLSDHGDNIIATSSRSIFYFLNYFTIKYKLVNNNSYENFVKGNIFLPFFKKAHILIGGEGQEVLVKEISGKITSRDHNIVSSGDLLNSSFFTNEKRNCECCVIF